MVEKNRPPDEEQILRDLSNLQITKLRRLREKVLAGEVSESTNEAKQLEFGRWLVDHNRVTDFPT